MLNVVYDSCAVDPSRTFVYHIFSLHFQVERFGRPTWRRLAEAVEDHVGGNNLALAQSIAGKHPGVLP